MSRRLDGGLHSRRLDGGSKKAEAEAAALPAPERVLMTQPEVGS